MRPGAKHPFEGRGAVSVLRSNILLLPSVFERMFDPGGHEDREEPT
jgi:hypothetical protein